MFHLHKKIRKMFTSFRLKYNPLTQHLTVTGRQIQVWIEVYKIITSLNRWHVLFNYYGTLRENVLILLLLYFNPFAPNAPILYPLKTLENHRVFWCFLGVEKGCIVNKWVKHQTIILQSLKMVAYQCVILQQHPQTITPAEVNKKMHIFH